MPRILIVEDDKHIAMALSVRLKSQGFEILVAYDAMAGVGTAVKELPDLVLLDITMPAGGGFSVAKRLRGMPATEQIPVIFLTASKNPETHQQAMTYQPVGLFEKPYNPVELLAAIHSALGHSEPPA